MKEKAKPSMKINIFPLIFSAVCALCTACSSPSQAAAAQTSCSPRADLVALQSGGVNRGASTQDGFYYVNTKARKDGSCNLMYLVFIGYADEPDRITEDDGTSKFIQVPRCLYSIMSKSDFWNGANIQHSLQYNVN